MLNIVVALSPFIRLARRFQQRLNQSTGPSHSFSRLNPRLTVEELEPRIVLAASDGIHLAEPSTDGFSGALHESSLIRADTQVPPLVCDDVVRSMHTVCVESREFSFAAEDAVLVGSATTDFPHGTVIVGGSLRGPSGASGSALFHLGDQGDFEAIEADIRVFTSGEKWFGKGLHGRLGSSLWVKINDQATDFALENTVRGLYGDHWPVTAPPGSSVISGRILLSALPVAREWSVEVGVSPGGVLDIHRLEIDLYGLVGQQRAALAEAAEEGINLDLPLLRRSLDRGTLDLTVPFNPALIHAFEALGHFETPVADVESAIGELVQARLDGDEAFIRQLLKPVPDGEIKIAVAEHFNPELNAGHFIVDAVLETASRFVAVESPNSSVTQFEILATLADDSALVVAQEEQETTIRAVAPEVLTLELSPSDLELLFEHSIPTASEAVPPKLLLSVHEDIELNDGDKVTQLGPSLVAMFQLGGSVFGLGGSVNAGLALEVDGLTPRRVFEFLTTPFVLDRINAASEVVRPFFGLTSKVKGEAPKIEVGVLTGWVSGLGGDSQEIVGSVSLPSTLPNLELGFDTETGELSSILVGNPISTKLPDTPVKIAIEAQKTIVLPTVADIRDRVSESVVRTLSPALPQNDHEHTIIPIASTVFSRLEAKPAPQDTSPEPTETSRNSSTEPRPDPEQQVQTVDFRVDQEAGRGDGQPSESSPARLPPSSTNIVSVGAGSVFEHFASRYLNEAFGDVLGGYVVADTASIAGGLAESLVHNVFGEFTQPLSDAITNGVQAVAELPGFSQLGSALPTLGSVASIVNAAASAFDWDIPSILVTPDPVSTILLNVYSVVSWVNARKRYAKFERLLRSTQRDMEVVAHVGSFIQQHFDPANSATASLLAAVEWNLSQDNPYWDQRGGHLHHQIHMPAIKVFTDQILARTVLVPSASAHPWPGDGDQESASAIAGRIVHDILLSSLNKVLSEITGTSLFEHVEKLTGEPFSDSHRAFAIEKAREWLGYPGSTPG